MPTITGLQVKTHGVKLLDNATANVYGIGAMSFDTGGDNMQVDGIVKAFDIPPTAADVTSASLCARCSDASVGPMTGYICSWQRGDGADSAQNSIRFLTVNAGAIAIIPGGTTTGIPTPNAGDTFSFKVGNNVLTALINGKQWATVTDSTIAAGHYGGLHFFRTATTDNAVWDNVNVFSITVAPPVTGTRDNKAQPFQGGDNVTNGKRCAPWNMPLGQIVTDPRRVQPAGANFNISSNNGFGVEVGGAGYPLVVNNTNEGHYSIYQANGQFADEYYLGRVTNGVVTSFTNHMVTDTKGLGVGVGFDVATEESQLGGLIRLTDLQNPSRLHALQVINAATVLATGHVWPATFQDGYASSNTGFMPYGSLMAIKRGSTIPNFVGLGHTAQEAADLTYIWNCLFFFGGYNNDGQGAVTTGTANLTSLRAEAAASGRLTSLTGGTAGMQAIGAQLVWVTNNTTDSGVTNLGGPGTRIAPYLAVI